MRPETQFVEINKFVERLEILEEAMIELIDHYLENISTRYKDLSDAFENKDIDKIIKTAHTVKNDISQFDADLVYKHALLLENAARVDDYEEAKKLFGRFKLYHDELKEELIELKKWLNETYG
jgi:HPt (histidine-containing phosphotransfer) domain-containing protein